MKRAIKKIVMAFVISSAIIATLQSDMVMAETLTLRMLLWDGYAPEDHRQTFIQMVRQKYGIDLVFDISYAKTFEDFFIAVRDGKTDIISPAHNIPKDKRFPLIANKLLLPLNLKNIPNYQSVLPALQRLDFCVDGDDVYGVPIARGPIGLAYNTAHFSNAPTTWNILWDEQYKGQYALSPESEINIYITALAMGIPPSQIADYKTVNTPEFQAKLAQLAINAHHFWQGLDQPEDLQGLQLAASTGYPFPALKEKGEIWAFAEPQEGTPAWIDHLMLAYTLENQPQLKQIAEEWLNYVLTDAFQTHIVRNTGNSPVTTTVNAQLTPEEIAWHHLDDPTYIEQHYILWPLLEKLDRKGFERLWADAVAQRK